MLDPGTRVPTELAHARFAPSRDEPLGCVYLKPLQDYVRRVNTDPQLVDSVPVASAMVTFWYRPAR